MSTLKDVARIIAERNDLTKAESEQFLSTFFDTIKSALVYDEQVKIKGLGTFKIQTMKERASVNINTGEKVIINSHERITFTPDASMRDSVNAPFAHFETVVLNDGVTFDDIDNGISSEDKSDAIPNTDFTPLLSDNEDKNDATDSESGSQISAEAYNSVGNQSKLIGDDESATSNDGVFSAASSFMPTAVNVAKTTDAESMISDNGNTISLVENEQMTESEGHQENLSGVEMAEENLSSEKDTEILAGDDKVHDIDVLPSETEKPETAEPVIAHQEHKPADIVSPHSDSEAEAQANDVEQNENDNNTDEDMENLNPSKNSDNSTATIVGIIFSVISLFVGFVIGRATSDISWNDVSEMISPSKKPVKVKVVYKRIPMKPEATDTMAAKIDAAKENAVKPSVKTIVPEPKADAKPQPAKAETKVEKKAAEVKKTEPKVAEKAPVNDEIKNKSIYDKDPRVRTGAYSIVGIKQVVTVGKGQTLASIAKAYLGPGMECYVEAVNGTKTVSEGQKVKIPELKLKKKK